MTKQKIQQFLKNKAITTVEQLKDIFNSAEKRTDLYASLEESEYSIFTYLCSVSDFTVFTPDYFVLADFEENEPWRKKGKIFTYAKIPDMRLPIWEQTQTTGGIYIYIAGYDPYTPTSGKDSTSSEEFYKKVENGSINSMIRAAQNRNSYLRLQEKKKHIPQEYLTIQEILNLISTDTEEEFDKIIQGIKLRENIKDVEQWEKLLRNDLSDELEKEIFKQFDVTQEDVKKAMSEAAENLKEDYSEGDLNLNRVEEVVKESLEEVAKSLVNDYKKNNILPDCNKEIPLNTGTEKWNTIYLNQPNVNTIDEIINSLASREIYIIKNNNHYCVSVPYSFGNFEGHAPLAPSQEYYANLTERQKKEIKNLNGISFSKISGGEERPYGWRKIPKEVKFPDGSVDLNEIETANKTDYSEINLGILDIMAERFTANKHKYPKGNMLKPIDSSSLLWATFRHLKKMIKPMKDDPETYDEHLAAILCNMSMILDQKDLHNKK